MQMVPGHAQIQQSTGSLTEEASVVTPENHAETSLRSVTRSTYTMMTSSPFLSPTGSHKTHFVNFMSC